MACDVLLNCTIGLAVMLATGCDIHIAGRTWPVLARSTVPTALQVCLHLVVTFTLQAEHGLC